MGVEYYLVKPKKKEVFYLGKHISCPQGINDKQYTSELSCIKYKDFNEFFWDFIRENMEIFCDTDLSSKDIRSIIFKIYEWCNSEVYFDNDCRENLEWSDYKETGSLIDLFEYYNKGNNKMLISDLELATYLFDGNSEKASILLELLHRANFSDEKAFEGIEMKLPEDKEN